MPWQPTNPEIATINTFRIEDVEIHSVNNESGPFVSVVVSHGESDGSDYHETGRCSFNLEPPHAKTNASFPQVYSLLKQALYEILRLEERIPEGTIT